MSGQCPNCGKKRTVAFEGHFIDGSWGEIDQYLDVFMGDWLCSFKCYKSLWERIHGWYLMMDNFPHALLVRVNFGHKPNYIEREILRSIGR